MPLTDRPLPTETIAPAHDLASLGELAALSRSVEAGVNAMRQFIGMEVAYATRISDGHQVIEAIDGDGHSFALREGLELPMEETFCRRVLSGRLPNLIPDVQADDRAASVPVGQKMDVGAFVSLPLQFSDGRLYGTLCAGSHLPKPSLGYRDLQFLKVFARIVADQLEREELQQRTETLQEAAHELELQVAASSALMSAVDARDTYTADHSRAVVDQAVAVGREIGLSEGEIIDLKHVALLHDIGKIAVPDSILQKAGSLDDAEWEVMRRHPVCGESILKATRGLAHLAPYVRAEHERWDGSGYPDGLAGEQIPIISRIALVCDAYHAMTSDRPYRTAMTPDAARREIAANAGTQFCPTAARALLATLEAD